ncbi:MAG TPA: AraC family transcriptional regulator, partial [Firmicutes bacterium]|nr:AraC family transcriptional regulator [Bacillota bacterium]
SPSYMQKIFPKIVGKTPHQYIMECRHRKARELLVKTKVSMEEVARQCGFVNSSHFSTTFKQAEDISPFAYRKAHLQAEDEPKA